MIFDFLFVILIIIASLYDIKKRIIPNKLCLVMLIIVILKLTYTFLININNSNFIYSSYILTTLAGFLLAFISFGVPFYINKSIGGADFKIGCCIGLFLGFNHTLSLLFISFFSSALFAIIININKSITKKPKIKTLPFVPFLLLGSFYIMSIKYFL